MTSLELKQEERIVVKLIAFLQRALNIGHVEIENPAFMFGSLVECRELASPCPLVHNYF